MNNIELSIVIPCYNSEKTISVLVEEIIRNISSKQLNYEVILINDYSKDSTLDKIRLLSKKIHSSNRD